MPKEVPQSFLPKRRSLPDTNLHADPLLNAKGTIFFTDAGKLGSVAQKILTLVPLGIKFRFLFPADSLHGDMGISSYKDLFLLFSNRGNTEELLRLVPCAKAKGVHLKSVTLVKKPNGLMQLRNLKVHLPLERQLCPFYLGDIAYGAQELEQGRVCGKPSYGRTRKSLVFKEKTG